MAIDSNAARSGASFWLDVADRVIEFLALLVGAAWTWMHYQRSRTYAKKLELDLEGTVFFRGALYLETTLGVKNLGAARHPVHREGTFCSVWAVLKDLSETPILLTRVFEMNNWIEPGESIDDSKLFLIDFAADQVLWLKVNLRVVSADAEWNLTRHIRVEIVE